MQNLYIILTKLNIDLIIKYLFRNKLKVIMFHGIIDDNSIFDCYWLLRKAKFIEQISYLDDNFNIISLDEALSGEILPENSIVLTFDDGYKSMLTHVYPILEKKKLPFTVYVTTGPVAHNSMLWADKVFLYFSKNNFSKNVLNGIELDDFSIGSNIDGRQLAVEFLEYLKKLDYYKKNSIIDQLDKNHSEVVNDFQGYRNPFEMLTIEDVKELSSNQLVTIGAHTVNHEILTSMPVVDAVEEVAKSKEVLESWTGKPVEHFAYPDGGYNKILADKIRQLSFKSASRIGLSINWDINAFELRRIGTDPQDDNLIFNLMVNGVIPLKVELRNLLKSGYVSKKKYREE